MASTTCTLMSGQAISRFNDLVWNSAFRRAATFGSVPCFICMRIRLAIYGAASLILLAFYAPARALTSLIAGLRDR